MSSCDDNIVANRTTQDRPVRQRQLSNRNPDDQAVRLIAGDALEALDKVEAESVQLVITSPPYNIGKIYERDVALSLEEYIAWLTPIIDKLCEKVKPGGSVCWQVGNFVRDGEVFPLDLYFYELFKKRGLKLRNRIVWRFNFGLHATKRFSGRYETLLWFTKGEAYTFNLDPVRVPQLYPGKKHPISKGGGRAGKPSGNPFGKNPSDFWTFSATDLFGDQPVWDIPNVKANHPEQTIHPCQFPHELAERCVLAFTNAGDVVLDPFVGAGTSVIAALKAGRRPIGIDKSNEYITLTKERVAALNGGRLKLRRSGTEIVVPMSTHAVAKRPTEWARGK
jgi:DNA modification methylase